MKTNEEKLVTALDQWAHAIVYIRNAMNKLPKGGLPAIRNMRNRIWEISNHAVALTDVPDMRIFNLAMASNGLPLDLEIVMAQRMEKKRESLIVDEALAIING